MAMQIHQLYKFKIDSKKLLFTRKVTYYFNNLIYKQALQQYLSQLNIIFCNKHFLKHNMRLFNYDEK